MDEDGESEDFETKSTDEESEFDEDSYSSDDDDSTAEIPLTDDEVQNLIDELLAIESKAAEAQEVLEEESLAALRVEIKEELARNIFDSEELNKAVDEEMNTYTEQWQEALDELEDQSSLLQENLDEAGVDLSDLFKWIEKQAPHSCSTEAWKKRTHWAGLNASDEVYTAIKKAEQDLNIHRPVKRHHGKSMEEGASGFLRKKLLDASTSGASKMEAEGNDGWDSMDALFESGGDIEKSGGFGTKSWASVYLAATPEQAALLGVPGADEVEEIVDLDKCKKDFLTAAAIANEKETGFTEQQKRNIRKVGEEEDIKKTRIIDRFILRRKRKMPIEDSCSPIEFDKGTSEQAKASNASSIRSVKFSELDMQQQSSQKCKTGEASGFCLRNNNTIIIDIESDEEQVPKEITKPVHGNDATTLILPDENGVQKPRASMVMVDSRMDDDKEEKPFSKDDKRSKELAIVPHGDLSQDRSSLTISCKDKEGDMDFMCTICGEKLQYHQVHKHPLLSVIVCRTCRQSYKKARFSKDSTGSFNECCWCASGGNVIMCEQCDRVFCSECITLNFGSGELEAIMSSEEWVCYCCNNEALKPKIDSLKKANELSSSNAGVLDDNVHFELRTNERRRKRLRRILDDDELEESTILKQKLERERKERLARLRESATNSSVLPVNSSLQECPINVARDADEEEVLIPFGIAKFLKPHQIEGVRFMWENCIESLKKVKAGDPGNGCILAHNMGLGKTLQVIAFLYTVLKRKDLGLRTALIVTPVNVLHNWPDEFEKWKPPDCKKIRVYVLDEVSRNLRKDLLYLWKKTGGVMMIGYTAFRTMSFGKHSKNVSEKEAINISLQNPGPDILICDEAHMIKNKKADITQALKQVKTQRRIALTGSPLQNNLMEYYCMVDFVREGFLGRPEDFKNRFQNPIENGQHADSTEYDVRCMKERTHVLHKQLMGFVQRKGVNVVEKELPKKTIYVLSVRLSHLQRALYNRFVQYFWLSNEQPPLAAKHRKCLFPTYHALAKVWNHPDLLFLAKEEKDLLSEDSMDDIWSEDGVSSEDENNDMKKQDKRTSQKTSKKMESEIMRIIESFDWCKDVISDMDREVLENSGKFVLLLHILLMSSAKSEKVLVFSQSLPTLNLIECFLGKIPRPGGKSGCWRRDKEWYRLDGHTKARDRQKLVKRFNDPTNFKVQCVLISTKAGSLGINLQAANRVVIVDGSWNPTHDIQALFRAWRFGQKKPVFVYRLLAYGTAEEKIYKRQVAKEGLAARVLDAQQVERHSKMEELKILFKLDDDVSECSEKQNMEDGSSEVCSNSNNNLNTTPEDEVMTKLMTDHSPKWIVRIHQHDTLLEDREEEKLTLEEQDLAWEKFKRITENTGADWMDGDLGPNPTYVQNSYANPVEMGERSSCSTKLHAELLVNSDVKNNMYVRCVSCEQMIGWEHIVKGRAFIPRKK